MSHPRAINGQYAHDFAPEDLISPNKPEWQKLLDSGLRVEGFIVDEYGLPELLRRLQRAVDDHADDL